MAPETLGYERIEVGELQTNCYLLYSKISRTCMIIDPGAEAEKIIRAVETLKLKPAGIILTHGHYDHSGAVREVKTHFRIPLWIHEQEGQVLDSPIQSDLLAGLGFALPPPADWLVNDGDQVTLGDLSLSIMHTPGHTPGSIVLHIDGWLFSGDTLFQGDIGRTDLPGGDSQLMAQSLERIMALPDETLVLPGHGESTTIRDEKEINPYL